MFHMPSTQIDFFFSECVKLETKRVKLKKLGLGKNPMDSNGPKFPVGVGLGVGR